MSEQMFSSLDSADRAKSPTHWKAYLLGILIVVIPVGLNGILEWFDDTTELWPNHDGSLEACFWIAGGCAFIVFLFILNAARKSTKGSIWKGVPAALGLSLAACIFAFMIANRIVDLVNGKIDFPSAISRTFPGLIQISRAYQTHGKGVSSNIQTMPIWSNMEITDEDFAFMRKHRRPGDAGHNPDEISSKGYFCVKVTLQQSGNALRVLHAGSHKLPPGTVILCPATAP